jgi:hypothetical protein
LKAEACAALGLDSSDRVGRVVVVNGEGRVLSRGEFVRGGGSGVRDAVAIGAARAAVRQHA